MAGYDREWIKELSPSADDDAVLSRSLADGRVLVTFDKDFGEIAFRHGKTASCGVVLLHPRLRSPITSLGSLWPCLDKPSRGKATFQWLRKESCAWCRCRIDVRGIVHFATTDVLVYSRDYHIRSRNPMVTIHLPEDLERIVQSRGSNRPLRQRRRRRP